VDCFIEGKVIYDSMLFFCGMIVFSKSDLFKAVYELAASEICKDSKEYIANLENKARRNYAKRTFIILYSSLNIITVMKSRRMKWAGRAERKATMRNSYSFNRII
jgi:hypothetical protein